MLYKNWLIESSNVETPDCPPLKDDIETDCLVIGGGVTGLHAALKLIESGKEVVLLEKDQCGSSSSGKSAGFLTPETELDLGQLIETHGQEKARVIYDIPSKGVDLIVGNIQEHQFDCDFRKQDTLYFSDKTSHNKIIEEEAKNRKENDLPYELLDKTGLKTIHPGKGYIKAMKYPGSYGINSFAYCKEMKKLLLKKGAMVFEGSEVRTLKGNTAKTHLGSVKAKNILVCIDKMKTEFHEDFSRQYYHLQTYVSVSEPLEDEEMKAIFPDRELMCWDSRLIYIHYRPVGDNRILIGGSSPWVTYLPYYKHSPRVISSFIKKLKKAFPVIKDVKFNYYWSGMLDVTKDLIPMVDYDKNNRSIQYALGCAGLNWAAYCGDYMARRVLDPNIEDLTEFLGSGRKFWISANLQRILGKRISFFLNHLYEFFKT